MPDFDSNNPLDLVREFHQAFADGDASHIADKPGVPADDRRELRFELIREEWLEFIDAWETDDLVEIADALADLTYVIYGTALEYGIPLDRVLAEVHHSNMTKLDENSDPLFREDGKILKGPLYEPPNIRKILGLPLAP